MKLVDYGPSQKHFHGCLDNLDSNSLVILRTDKTPPWYPIDWKRSSQYFVYLPRIIQSPYIVGVFRRSPSPSQIVAVEKDHPQPENLGFPNI